MTHTVPSRLDSFCVMLYNATSCHAELGIYLCLCTLYAAVMQYNQYSYTCDAAPCSYLQQEQHMFLTAHCLDVEFTGTQHHMQIDLASVEALELIKPLTAGGATKKGNSLYRYQKINLTHHYTSE